LYKNFSHRYSVDSSEITHIEKLKWKPLLPSTDKVTQRLIDRLFVVDNFNISINSNHHYHNHCHDDDGDSNGNHHNVTANFDHISGYDGENYNDDDGSLEVVRIRFMGESFLTGQIRSIIGVLLSVFHGYLPMVIMMMMMFIMIMVVLRMMIVVVIMLLMMIMVVVVIIIILMMMMIVMRIIIINSEYKIYVMLFYPYRNLSNILNDRIL
jgi:hypothetical protein